MGFPKPGSTFQPTVPAQGGKGGARPTTNSPLQPGATIFNGVVTPNTIGPNGQPVGGTMPGGKAPGAVQPTQPQVPAQGGKGGTSNVPGYAQPYVNALTPQVQQLAPGQVPPQGGKGTSRQDYDRMMAQTSFSGAPPTYEQFVQNRLNRPQMPQVMPQKPGVPMQPQVPAQGGKAPLTPEQQAALGPYVSPARPQVMPMSPQQSPYGPYYDANGRPTAVGTGGPGLLMRPQVLPQKRMPANMAPQQGLAGLKNMLYGGKR